jgi:hypothetical protein
MAKLIDAFLQRAVARGPKIKWEYDIKVDSEEIGMYGVKWVHLVSIMEARFREQNNKPSNSLGSDDFLNSLSDY